MVDAFTKIVGETEEQQRTMLRLSLEAAHRGLKDLPLRQGRGIGWFTEALEPARAVLGDARLNDWCSRFEAPSELKRSCG